MIKVKLITLHRIFNYGSVLQTYATQEIFKNHGADIEIIDYVNYSAQNKVLFWKYEKKGNRLYAALYKLARIPVTYLRKRKFMSFLHRRIEMTKTYSNYEKLTENPPKADIFITGSDQCWNSFYVGIEKGYYLQFGDPHAKRVSFATSVGNESFSETERSAIIKYLSQYKYISVRESVSVKVLERILGRKVYNVIDPTLQLTRDEWNTIACKRMISGKYAVLFVLYGEDLGATEYARKIADDLNIRLVEISWALKKRKLIDILMSNRKPEEFLALIRDAEYVITNSFHGLAFSIIFNRQFMVVERSQFNNRLSCLLEMLGLQDRVIRSSKNMDIVNKRIDYRKVNEILDNKREEASRYIDMILND